MVFGDKDGFVRYRAALQDVKQRMRYSSASGDSRGGYYVQHTGTSGNHPRYVHGSSENTKGSDEAARLVAHAASSHLSFQGNIDSAHHTFYSESKMATTFAVDALPSGAYGDVGGKMGGDDLEEALDDIYERRILFLGRFELYSQVCFPDRGLCCISARSPCHVVSAHA